ncbi:MAG TPA: HAD family hydrolase [Alphaproteobacteria bacterium]|nr:HAD family hydrolase [Alphaproteobacteria bacterium]
MANIIFDWDGTIAKPDVAKEAATRRFKTLGETVDEKWLKAAMKTNDHYAVNKKIISEYTGITDEKELTIIMTDLFRFHYIAVIKEWKEKSLYEGMKQVIEKLSKKNKIVIASTLRQDLLEYSLANLGMEKYFEKVFANTPDLKYTKDELVLMAQKYFRKPNYMIGDKDEDIAAGRKSDCMTIFVSWGAGGFESSENPDYIVNSPKEILKIIK